MTPVKPCQWEICSVRLHTTSTPASESCGCQLVCLQKFYSHHLHPAPATFFPPWDRTYRTLGPHPTHKLLGKKTSHQHLSCFSTYEHREHHTVLQGHKLGLADVTVWCLHPEQTRPCVFLTQQPSGWDTALPLPRANRIAHWECKTACCTSQQSAAGGKHHRRTLHGETLSPLPHTPVQGSFLQEESLEQQDKEHLPSTGMLAGIFGASSSCLQFQCK